MKSFFLPLILIVTIAGVFLLTNSFGKKTSHFYGITDNHEQTVSFQEPVEITEIRVIEGQHVQQGDVLVKAKRSELSSQHDLLINQIDELDAQQKESVATITAEISVLRAKRRAELAQIDVQIQQLQSRQNLNNALYQKITGVSRLSSAQSGPLTEQLQALRKQRQYTSKSLQAQINALRTKIKAGKQPILVQKKQVSEHLNELQRQMKELTIHADFTGRIGSINFKQGERVPSFQGILTVHGMYPEFVKGYIHENVSNDVRIGQQVWIHPIYNESGKAITGIVESLGSRIVEYPERLRKNMGIKSWGREANIRLQANNPLLLGEKVQISFSPLKPDSAEAYITPVGEKLETILPSAFADKFKSDNGTAPVNPHD